MAVVLLLVVNQFMKSHRFTLNGFLDMIAAVGRTLAELMLGQETVRTSMPWVFRSDVPSALRRWEPEPLRWLGFKLLWSIFGWEEALYREGTAPAWRMKLAKRAADLVEKLL